METCILYDNDNLLLKNEAGVPYTSDDDLDSLWLQDSSNPSFHCIQSSASSMVNFEDVNNTTTQKTSFKKINKVIDSEEAIFDVVSSQKKRRLSADQVHFLEKSFDVDNKLEPDRKVQLAKELGLQPRQVAIWFQNRRARFKTKLLQKDYDVLKSSYDCLKRDYDALFSENEKLKNEVNMLTEKLLANENGSDQLPKKEPCCDDSIAQSDAKQSSAKSDVMDSDSPRYCTTDGIHSTTKMLLEIERGDSSNAFEAAAETTISDYEAEGDSLSKSLLLQAAAAASSSCFPKLEVADDEYSACYDNDLQPNSNCNLGFPVQNHGTWFWQI